MTDTERAPGRVRVHETETRWHASWPLSDEKWGQRLFSGIAMTGVGVLALWVLVSSASTARTSSDSLYIILLRLPVVSLFLGMGLMVLFNRTHCRVDAGTLRVRGSPIPWPLRRWDRLDIERLDVQPIIGARGSSTWKPPEVRHQLVVTGRDRRQRRIDVFPSWDEAVWVHGQIKRRLNLPD
jgi:hypothetical protein